MAEDAPQEECRGAVRDPEPGHRLEHRTRDHRKLPAAHPLAQRPCDRAAESGGLSALRAQRASDRADRPRDAQAALLRPVRPRQPAVRAWPRADRARVVRCVRSRQPATYRFAGRARPGRFHRPFPRRSRSRLGSVAARRVRTPRSLTPNRKELSHVPAKPVPPAFQLSHGNRARAWRRRVARHGASCVAGIGPVHVFDPSNYSQNLLTAARTLQQINNQIQSLQNEATMLINQAKNLTRIDFPELQVLTQTIQQIDRLMGQAQGISYRIGNIDSEFRQLYPHSFNQALTTNTGMINARTRMDTSMAAFNQTMQVQAQVVGSVAADSSALASIVAKSQGAEGGLQAQQATNQLLALAAKQQFQIQNMMAAQYRAEALEAARRVQAETDARGATTRFLGNGTAYHPQ
ncbi:Conjugative transfer protein TrbJ [hydrothermal vent metagenome]|uniref:Conjugative transfer protein TrbJ n=1 Tax=hydrothermal vent metagenome TaxID=652676 RepID=A0A160TP55_9ZZZZ